MKSARFHPKARDVIQEFPVDVRKALGKAVFDLQKGHKLHMPLSRAMSNIGVGVEELRIKDAAGIYRVFYYTRVELAVLVLHAFVKKGQKTPKHDIHLGRRRLREMMNNEKET